MMLGDQEQHSAWLANRELLFVSFDEHLTKRKVHILYIRASARK